jgi:flagellar hook-basal body complex protein FliE
MSPLSSISATLPGVSLTPPVASPLPVVTDLAKPQDISGSPAAGGDSFASMLGRMVSDINAQQVTASQTVSAVQSGQPVPLHQAVISMEEANVSFQLMVEVRNRLLEGFQEIMRMQI